MCREHLQRTMGSNYLKRSGNFGAGTSAFALQSFSADEISWASSGDSGLEAFSIRIITSHIYRIPPCAPLNPLEPIPRSGEITLKR